MCHLNFVYRNGSHYQDKQLELFCEKLRHKLKENINAEIREAIFLNI